MTENQQSTKWIDYSDGSEVEDSDDEEVNKQNKTKQSSQIKQTVSVEPEKSIEKLGKIVWLQAKIKDESRHIDLVNLIQEIKQQDDLAKVFKSREDANLLEIRVLKNIAEDILKNGYREEKGIQWSLHKKNFEKRQYNNDPRKNGYERRGRGRERGRGRGQRHQGNQREPYDRNRQPRGNRNNRNNDGEKKKTKYVDKETGKESENKKIYERRVMQDKQRQYSKKQIEQMGQGLNFRKTPLEQRRKQKQKQEKKEEKKPDYVSDKKIKNPITLSSKNVQENKQEEDQKKVIRKGKKKYTQKTNEVKDQRVESAQKPAPKENKEKKQKMGQNHFIEMMSEDDSN